MTVQTGDARIVLPSEVLKDAVIALLIAIGGHTEDQALEIAKNVLAPEYLMAIHIIASVTLTLQHHGLLNTDRVSAQHIADAALDETTTKH